MSNPKWSERPNSDGMEQVRVLLRLINHKRLDRVVVATNFTFQRIQAAHPRYEF
jgi:hypothetical protein